MFPPVFDIASADPNVTAVLGGAPKTRLWPFGMAPQNEVRPYAVWQTLSGQPDESLSCIPREDLYTVQIDAYAKTVSGARQVAQVLRDTYEATQNSVDMNGEFWEQSTGLFRYSLTVEFWTERAS